MKVAWAMVAGALLAVPILALPSRSPARADAELRPLQVADDGIKVVLRDDKGRTGKLRIRL